MSPRSNRKKMLIFAVTKYMTWYY